MSQQRRCLCRPLVSRIRLHDGFLFIVLLNPRPSRLRRTRPAATIPQRLRKQDDIGEGVIDSEHEHGRQDMLQDAAKDIEDVAAQPSDHEDQRQPISRAPAHILHDLRREHDHPARDGDAAHDAGQGVHVDVRRRGHFRSVWPGVKRFETV